MKEKENSSKLWKVVRFSVVALIFTSALFSSYVIWGNPTSKLQKLEAESANVYVEPDILRVSPVESGENILISSEWEGTFFTVTVHDIDGNLIAKNKMITLMNSELLVSTSELPTGIYFVALTYEDEVIAKKVFNL